ncbi:MAG: hypothetical protein MR545_00985 [Veillonellaceae bacterium]|nr:hypothetical protein [Veillonellaceae bacterium]
MGLYITLFPQLIAGPIVRYDVIEKQILQRQTWECKIVCVKSNCADLFYAPYWGKQLKGWISNGKT